MDSFLIHHNQIRVLIHHNSQANINSSHISKLRIDIILSQLIPIPNFNLNLDHSRVVLPSPISILTLAIILILILIITIEIVVLCKMDHRTITSCQDFRILLPIRLLITLHQTFSQNHLSSQMPIRRGRRIRMYRACRQRRSTNVRSTVIRDAVVHKDQA